VHRNAGAEYQKYKVVLMFIRPTAIEVKEYRELNDECSLQEALFHLMTFAMHKALKEATTVEDLKPLLAELINRRQ
jgi:hypothetical protein